MSSESPDITLSGSSGQVEPCVLNTDGETGDPAGSRPSEEPASIPSNVAPDTKENLAGIIKALVRSNIRLQQRARRSEIYVAELERDKANWRTVANVWQAYCFRLRGQLEQRTAELGLWQEWGIQQGKGVVTDV